MLENLTQAIAGTLRKLGGKANISERNIRDAVQEIQQALLDADVNLRVVRRFINSTIQDAQGEAVLRSVNPGQQFTKIVNDRLVQFLGDSKQDLQLKNDEQQSVVLMLGLQGAGKTTTTAKLARLLQLESRKVLLVAADLQRPAAIEQLEILGKQLGVAVHSSHKEKKPLAVVKQALSRAKKELYNTVLIDTAGRLQIDEQLMKELNEIKKYAKPDETLLIADSMTGQNAANIARDFHESVGLSGVILTKFDADSRGGAALSIKTITGQAIKFIGMGEQLEDLEPFYPERIASRILGMGDVVSLVEKAQQITDQEEAEKLQKKIIKEDFGLEDMLAQFQQLRRLGSMEKISSMVPGMANMQHDPAQMERQMKQKEAIILSMTPKERRNFRIIGPSRRRRVARGSGTSVGEVNRLLKEFEKSRTMMKKMLKNKKYQAQMMNDFFTQK